MVHIFLYHRDLRIIDNTSLINQLKKFNQPVLPIFIFPPEQINPKKNKYFSNASVQFMIESLHELSIAIKDKKGELLFFKGDNLKVLKSIHEKIPIESISFNIDYTPYAKQRDESIKEWCNDNNIICLMKEDYPLYDILEGQTNKANNTPYLVYTPFLNHVTNNLIIRPIDKFKNFKFKKINELKEIKYYINENEIDKFYKYNENINVNGGRSNTLKILSKLERLNDYLKKRDIMIYKTSFLGPSLHFGTCSVREIYNIILKKLGNKSGLIRELIFRDFYINIVYNFPQVLEGQIKNKNKSFKEEYDNINWSYNKKHFEKWCNGQTGFPIVDACMRQLIKKSFMHNRGRMIVASFLTKDLHIDWKMGEQYFASKLVDYDVINNSQGWMWATGNGTDAQPWFRIFNPWTQQKTYDPLCEYIYEWIEELKDVEPYDIHNWFNPEIRMKYKNINYPEPMVDHDKERLKTIEIYKNALKK